jgi:hypothetical protein
MHGKRRKKGGFSSMIRNLMGRHRATAAVYLAAMAVILLSFLCLDLSPGAASAASGSQVKDLRSAVTGGGFADVALLDALTPVPDVSGKTILFVDGSYFATAGDDVVADVVSSLENGVCIVFFGGGYGRVRAIVPNLPYTEAKVKGTMKKAPTTIEGVYILPGVSVDGRPVGGMFNILGSRITASDVSSARDTAVATIAEGSAPKTGAFATSTGTWGNPGPDWVFVNYYSTTTSTDWYPYGKHNSWRYYFKSTMEMLPGIKERLLQVRVESVTGKNLGWPGNYQNANGYLKCQTRNALYSIEDHSPHNVSSPVGTYTIGLTAGGGGVPEIPGQFTIGGSWTQTLYAQDISDYSDGGGGYGNWNFNLTEDATTRVYDAGMCWKVPTASSGLMDISVQGKWAKDYYAWHHYYMGPTTTWTDTYN